MKLIRGISNLTATQRTKCVATLGSFDGVHLGHQKIIRRVIEYARQKKLVSTIITTEPLPREFFSPENSPPRLTRFRERLEIFADLGVECVLCIPFNRKLADTPAEVFVKKILVDGLHVKHMVCGDDTQFGKDRKGNVQLLQIMSKDLDFTVETTPTLSQDAGRVSSTRIRESLSNGNMEVARQLLGRDFHMSGRVAHGDKRGRSLGYPTANIHLRRRQTPVMGIFAVEVGGLASNRLSGVASVGVRPTFGGGQCILEVHLFNFTEDIYGQHVRVYFLHKLRDERRFESPKALVAQMRIDEEQARDFFNHRLC